MDASGMNQRPAAHMADLWHTSLSISLLLHRRRTDAMLKHTHPAPCSSSISPSKRHPATHPRDTIRHPWPTAAPPLRDTRAWPPCPQKLTCASAPHGIRACSTMFNRTPAAPWRSCAPTPAVTTHSSTRNDPQPRSAHAISTPMPPPAAVASQQHPAKHAQQGVVCARHAPTPRRQHAQLSPPCHVHHAFGRCCRAGAGGGAGTGAAHPVRQRRRDVRLDPYQGLRHVRARATARCSLATQDRRRRLRQHPPDCAGADPSSRCATPYVPLSFCASVPLCPSRR